MVEIYGYDENDTTTSGVSIRYSINTIETPDEETIIARTNEYTILEARITPYNPKIKWRKMEFLCDNRWMSGANYKWMVTPSLLMLRMI